MLARSSIKIEGQLPRPRDDEVKSEKRSKKIKSSITYLQINLRISSMLSALESAINSDSLIVGEKVAKSKRKDKLKGVFPCGKKFKAQIQIGGTQHYLGMFDSAEEAAKAYDEEALNALGTRARTNYDIDPKRLAEFAAQSRSSSSSRQQEQGSRPREKLKGRVYCGLNGKRTQSAVAAYSSSAADLQHQKGIQQLLLEQQRHRTRPAATSSLTPANQAVSDARDIHHGAAAATNVDTNESLYSPVIPPVADWRGKVYYWSGRVSFEASRLSWRGHWLGSIQGRPSAEQLGAAGQTFEYQSQSPVDPPGTPQSLVLAGYYRINNSEAHIEKEIVVDFTEVCNEHEDEGGGTSHGRLYAVSGRGDSAFGPFLLGGVYDTASQQLEMTRKYGSYT